MKTKELFVIYVDGEWKEDVDASITEVKEKIEKWINQIDFLDENDVDELLDTENEVVVSTIEVKVVLRLDF
jgi:hypothetical protein